jgi:C1A family cysteine protease
MDEENLRYQNFLNSLKLADERNFEERRLNGTATHGITQFADLSEDEFHKMFTNAELHRIDEAIAKTPLYEVNKVNSELKANVDWSPYYTTNMKNQGNCGSCWAFSATEQIESDAIRTLGWPKDDPHKLSAGQISACTYPRTGCNGGLPVDGYIGVQTLGGIETAYNYPYGNYYAPCEPHIYSQVIEVTGYQRLANDENAMTSFVSSVGTLSICLYAATWSTYTGGIMSYCPVDYKAGHCVQVVGVNTDAPQKYWKVRNSWVSNMFNRL